MPGLTYGDLKQLLEIYGFAGEEKSGDLEFHYPNRPHIVIRLGRELNSPAAQAALEEVVSAILINARTQHSALPTVSPPSRPYRLPRGTLPAALSLSAALILGVQVTLDYRRQEQPPPSALVLSAPEGPKAPPKTPRSPCPMAGRPPKKSAPQQQEVIPTNTTELRISFQIQAQKSTEESVAEFQKVQRRKIENGGCPDAVPLQNSSSHD